MKFVLAIGNPGILYKYNRHNLGLLFADWFLENTSLSFSRSEKKKCTVFKFNSFYLIRSSVFMNLSFEALSELYNLYKFTPEQLLVLHDELMRPEYEVSLKIGGGIAGHNGLRSLANILGQNFARLRFGIGHPKDFLDDRRFIAVDKYVLSNIDDLKIWESKFTSALSLFYEWLELKI